MSRRIYYPLLMFFLFSFLITTSLTAQRQEYSINGIVLDAETNMPLIGVNIFLKESPSIGTTTDRDGYFSLRLPERSGTLVFQYIGYKEYEMTVSTESVQKDKIVLRLLPVTLSIQPIVVTGTKVDKLNSPTPFTQITQNEIQENYGVRDVPMFLLDIPGVYAYSDNGTGMGYSYINIRGFDSKRVSVMINGVPHNDPEDHTVYWVDMPDLLESASAIQVQKGIGISPYAISSFGGSINLFTTGIPAENKSYMSLAFGSYNTQKYNIQLNRPLRRNWYLSFRLSKMKTDGYRENSGVDLWSYYFKLIKQGNNSYHQWNIYSGQEITHAAWEFSPESALKNNHRHNPVTYHNYIDNFRQPHYEYLYMREINPFLTIRNTVFYIHGIGYYESLKNNRNFYEYNLVPVDTGLSGDLIRQKWVAKDQLGMVTQMDYRFSPSFSMQGGSYLSYYSSRNWGEIKEILTPVGFLLPENDFQYYRYTHKKTYFNFFLAGTWKLHEKIQVSGNLYSQNIQFRFKHAELGNFKGLNRHAYDLSYHYLLPKFGVIYSPTSTSNFYLSLSRSQREPTANELYNTWYGADDLGIPPHFQTADTIYRNGQPDYIKWKNPKVQDERLSDMEIGYRYLGKNLQAEINLFRMWFDNEIVYFSAIDQDGFPITGNADKTIHEGVECSVQAKLSSHWSTSINFSWSNNYFKKFEQEIYQQNNVVDVVDYSGKTISGSPDILFNHSLEYQWKLLKIKATYHYRGRIYLDNSENKNRSIAPLKDLIDLDFIFRTGHWFGENTEGLIVAEINNVLNRKYYTAGYYDEWAAENYLIPAATRNFLLSLKLFF